VPPLDADIDQLGEFQVQLLELLARDLSLEALQKRLSEDEAFAAFRTYVHGFEPRMLEVAAFLVKKWGKRTTLGGKLTEG